MADLILTNSNSESPFDSIRREDADGEYWLGRELQDLLGYSRWNEFFRAIERAEISCKTLEGSSNIHFRHLTNLVKLPQGGSKRRNDSRLSRYACYLVAMNGDPHKPEISAAQCYFAARTREAEVIIPAQNERLRELELINDNLRLQNENLKTQIQWAQCQDNRIALHGLPTALMLEGKSDSVIEIDRPTIEVIDQNSKAKFKGQTTKQLAEYCNQRCGTKFKTGTEVAKRLKAAGREDLLATTPRAILQDYIPLENLHEAIDVLVRGDRQFLLGE